MMDFTFEQIAKAKKAKTAEELQMLARENHIELTVEEAKQYYDELNRMRELTDDELDAVAGGSRKKNGKTYSSDWPYCLIVTYGNSCRLYRYDKSASIDNGTCAMCEACTRSGVTLYCKERTIDCDLG